ncbi:MAG TPA: hypothetical protein VGR07_21695 [Thermoanaerobaculia bacterium]|jgi:ABC-2 type transport system permease protein|nr:hypothetical protein [Thermoanaerobaculia bacterium]
MAVYEQTYRRYAGELTPERSRFLIPIRYAFREVFGSKLVILLLSLAGLLAAAMAVLIYLAHNLEALKALNLPLGQLQVDNLFFESFVRVENGIAILLALVIGPGLIAPDLRNNALPLYFSRPFTRSEYVLSKVSMLVLLLSAITWVPGLLLFLLQAYLSGAAWTGAHLGLAWAVFAASCEWVVVLSLLTLAISAWVKWKPVARISLLAALYVFQGWAKAIDGILGTRWGAVVSVKELDAAVRSSLFDGPTPDGIPIAVAWLVLGATCLLCLAVLYRRIRAYEVVR